MEKLDLNAEVVRLLTVSEGVEKLGLPHPSEVTLMAHNTKIDILAGGVERGWYGDHWTVRKGILKDYYQEVMKRVHERKKWRVSK